MQLFEMQGLLAGKCLPGDMLVGESLAKYLLRQLNQRDELARQASALQTSQDNIINGLGIKGDGPYSKLVIEYVLGLVAERDAWASKSNDLVTENIALKHFIFESCVIPTGIDGYESAARHMPETPATDAAIAEIKAQGVDEFTTNIGDKASGLSTASNVYKVLKSVVFSGVEFAANLRAGRKG